MTRFRLKTPPGFRFAIAVRGHGWYDLLPFRWDDAGATLHLALWAADAAHDVSIRAAGDALAIAVDPGGAAALPAVRQAVRTMLRLDEDLAPLYALTDGDAALAYARAEGAGRLLRAPSAWEDLVKMLCTTNCSWSLTRIMIERLVSELGAPAPSGARTFPAPATMAAAGERFYRDVMRAGYRAPHLLALARATAGGTLDPEAWRGPASDDAELRAALLALPGIGPYAADNLLRLLGHYGYLGLDSWCRQRLKELYPRLRDPDVFAERRYRRFGRWRGLAMWLDLTRQWHQPTSAQA